MSNWAMKRFWTDVSVVDAEGGLTVHLDDKPIRTPHKSALILPNRALATAVAEEWEAQDGQVDPGKMPVTRGANSAIDKVRPQRDDVITMLAEYGDSDLLCYRAAGPEALIARQNALWDPLLQWADTELGARLISAEGVMHVPQSPEALQNLRKPLHDMSEFALVGMHDLITLSGSLVLAHAIVSGRLSHQDAWQLSRLDEEWQIEQWGEDEDARTAEQIKRDAFSDADRFYRLSQSA